MVLVETTEEILWNTHAFVNGKNINLPPPKKSVSLMFLIIPAVFPVNITWTRLNRQQQNRTLSATMACMEQANRLWTQWIFVVNVNLVDSCDTAFLLSATKTDRQTGRKSGGQIDGLTNRKTERQTETHLHTVFYRRQTERQITCWR